jgi:hypothetical protein
VTWRFKDYEPAQDVAILVHPMYLGRAAQGVPAKTPEDYRAAIARGAVNGAVLSEVAGELRSDPDELVEYARFFQEVARAKLGLPEPKEAEVRACVEESARLMESAAKPPAAPK